MPSIFGLIDPGNKRIFHIGCAQGDPTAQPISLPAAVARRVAEMAPTHPSLVILRTVEAHPQVEWVKWSKRFRRDIVTNDWEQYESIAKAFQNSKRAKRVLGEEIPSDGTNQARFHQFDRENPSVFEEMLRKARGLRAEGRNISGVEVLANDIRYEGADTEHSDGYKFNNNFKAYYARKLLMTDSTLCGLFVVRVCVSDDLVLDDGRSWRDFAREHSDVIRFAGPEGEPEEDAQWTY